MGGSKKNEPVRQNDGAPKLKRSNIFCKLGDRIRRVFHRKPRDRGPRIDDHRFSHSTGDLISDVPDQTSKVSHAFLPSGATCELAGPSLSAEDRAASEGHLQGACTSRGQPSEFLSPKATFLSSDFRNELNSKLRMPPRGQTSRPTGVSIKTTGSSGSLASDDSAIFKPTGDSDERLTSNDALNTPDSDGSANFSPSPASSFLAGTQHKLAVNRQRIRRPPTGFSVSTPLHDSHNQSSLDSSCASFFESSGSSLSTAHAARLDFITEEENELQPPTPQPSIRVSQISGSQPTVRPCTGSDETTDQPFGKPMALTENDTAHLPTKESNITGSCSTLDTTTEVESKQTPTTEACCGVETPISQATFTRHTSEVKHHSTHKRTLSDNEDDQPSLHSKTSSFARPALRPVSMYTPMPSEQTRHISPLPPRKRLQTLEGYTKSDFLISEHHNHVNKLSDCPVDENLGDEPELKSVADRASMFGTIIHFPRPAPLPPASPTEPRRRTTEHSETTANNRASRVFSLVKNFEQSC